MRGAGLRNHTIELVGPWGLEPQTFPASRDALAGLGGVDEFFNRQD